MRVLLSGATGFIGAALRRRLLSEGVTLSLLQRGTGSEPVPGIASVIAVDLSHPLPADLPLEGIDTVFHLAGVAHQAAAADLHERVNHVATLELARRAAAAGVRRFIYLSSVKAMGEPTDTAPRNEADCSVPQTAYGLSKWRAECGLRELAAATAMRVCILRPALVYGPGARGNLALLERWVRARLPAPPAHGGRSMVSRDDLVELLCHLGLEPSMPSATWIVSDGQDYTTHGLCAALAAHIGRSPLVPSPPTPIWTALAAVADLALRHSAGRSAQMLFGHERYSNAALLAATAWRPRQSFSSALAQGIV